MQEIVNTARFNLSYHPDKQRIYYTCKGFWQEDAEGREQVWKLVQNLEQQLPQQITALIDVTQLRLMHPPIAEDVIRHTVKFLLAKNVRGIAQVIDPDNVIVKMQFKRIIKTLDEVRDRIHVFTSRDAAETWLDSLDRMEPKSSDSDPLQGALIYLIVPVCASYMRPPHHIAQFST
jgi:hypothetical protein